MLTGLRSLLGFLHVVGIIDGSLASAVPAVAGWTQSGLPKPRFTDKPVPIRVSK
jgi:hypothetical protein